MRSFESPLSDDLAAEILNIPVPRHADVSSPETVGEVVRRSVEMIRQANRLLEESKMAQIVARSLMQSLKRRGAATIVVRADGTVVLRVTNGGDDGPAPRPRRDAPAVQSQHRSSLPYLDELRAEAKELGVDISHLGRQRRTIHEFLTTYKANLRPAVDEVRVTHVTSVALPPKAR